MDNLDRAILSYLQKDGRKPYTEIAQVLNVTEGTVRNRVAKLVEDRVVQIVGMVDPYQLGFDAPALIGVSIQPSELDTAAATIATFPEVSYLIMISGEYDLMVEVMCRNREHLATFIKDQLHQVTGITRTQTFLILHTYKMAYGAQPMLTQPK